MSDVQAPTPLLGGLSPAAFMRRFWQKKPLLVRQAWPDVRPPLPRAELFALAGREGVESRLVLQSGLAGAPTSRAPRAPEWQVRHGPFARRALPALARPGWTLLVQGLDLHVPAAHAMLAPFRFVPAARLDDLMVSWASAGGGVGPHADSYDVFLLQVQGRRRWRVAPPGAGGFVAGLPLKILRHFRPVHDWVLEPGDMLYLPPGWGHDGVAEGGDCMTCSVGFRAPTGPELAREMLQRLADEADESDEAGQAPEEHEARESDSRSEPDGAAERGPSARAARARRTGKLYADAAQPATTTPAAVPPALLRFAQRAVAQVLRDPKALERALGEALSEPKAQVWFDAGAPLLPGASVVLDARTRMLYDAHNLFINGESFRAAGRDARLLRRLADDRRLETREMARLSADAVGCLDQWAQAGWVHSERSK